MSLFTRARRHVDMNRVKKLREEKIKEETIAEVQRQQENILAELKRIEVKENPKYSNWRRDLNEAITCLLYTSPSPRDRTRSRMPSSA